MKLQRGDGKFLIVLVSATLAFGAALLGACTQTPEAKTAETETGICMAKCAVQCGVETLDQALTTPATAAAVKPTPATSSSAH